MPPNNLLQTAQSTDPLPRYTRDPETTSIRSSAPSYTSEVLPPIQSCPEKTSTDIQFSQAPSYHSNHTPQAPAVLPRSLTTTLPPSRAPLPHYAPGFRYLGSAPSPQNHSYNIAEWSPATNGPRARHYQAVANRRATMAGEAHSLMQTLTRLDTAIAASLNQGVPNQYAVGENEQQQDHAPNSYSSPLEDPSLVGDEAAASATARRIFLERCAEGEALREEQKGWDFMMAQMEDWGGRMKGLEGFRRSIPQGRLNSDIRGNYLKKKGKR